MPWLPWEEIRSFLLNLKRIIKLWPDMIHLYPFRPTEETLFSKKWYIYDEKSIKNRDLTYELSVKLVEKNWYYWVENDSWGKMDWAKNEQEVDKIVNNCSILWFGYPTRSYIHKNLMYFTGYNMYGKKEITYMWIKLSRDDYIIRYIISHFRSWFSISEINNLFWIDFERKFRKKIDYLKQNRIVYIKENYFYTKIRNVFSKLVFSKIFYTEFNMKLILEKYNYNSNINYIKKFNDTLSNSYK
jgi:hypothetical protein